MTDKTTQENGADVLLLQGRQAAGDILQQSVSNAKTNEQLNAQLYVLDCMAIHIIATNMYNRLKNMKDKSQAELVLETRQLIEDELEEILKHESEMEIIKKADQ